MQFSLLYSSFSLGFFSSVCRCSLAVTGVNEPVCHRSWFGICHLVVLQPVLRRLIIGENEWNSRICAWLLSSTLPLPDVHLHVFWYIIPKLSGAKIPVPLLRGQVSLAASVNRNLCHSSIIFQAVNFYLKHGNIFWPYYQIIYCVVVKSNVFHLNVWNAECYSFKSIHDMRKRLSNIMKQKSPVKKSLT